MNSSNRDFFFVIFHFNQSQTRFIVTSGKPFLAHRYDNNLSLSIPWQEKRSAKYELCDICDFMPLKRIYMCYEGVYSLKIYSVCFKAMQMAIHVQVQNKTHRHQSLQVKYKSMTIKAKNAGAESVEHVSIVLFIWKKSG